MEWRTEKVKVVMQGRALGYISIYIIIFVEELLEPFFQVIIAQACYRNRMNAIVSQSISIIYLRGIMPMI